MVIANLGRVRIVKFREAGDDPQSRAHLFEEPGTKVEMRPPPIRAVVSDQAGRFTQGGPLDRKAGMSYGEELNLESELQKQALARVAAKITEIVAAEAYPRWQLVMPREIIPSLLKRLPTSAQLTLAEVITGDLTKLPLRELEHRFLSNHLAIRPPP